MKRISMFILILLMLFILVSCASEENKQTNANKSIEKLTSEDFIINYRDVKVELGGKPSELFEKYGNGTANEDNNFGFIGWDSENKHKFYGHGYPEDDQVFFVITKVNIIDCSVIISQINIENITLNRGISPRDSIEDILKLYGEPTEKSTDNVNDMWIFKIDNKKLIFYLDNNEKIGSITLLYNDNDE